MRINLTQHTDERDPADRTGLTSDTGARDPTRAPRRPQPRPRRAGRAPPRGAAASVDPAALARAADVAPHRAPRSAPSDPVYGRTTGVGAAREESTDSDGRPRPAAAALARRRVGRGRARPRSCAPRWPCGPTSCSPAGPAPTPSLAQALADLVGAPEDDLPVVHRYGSLGHRRPHRARRGRPGPDRRARAGRRRPPRRRAAHLRRRAAADVLQRLRHRRDRAARRVAARAWRARPTRSAH